MCKPAKRTIIFSCGFLGSANEPELAPLLKPFHEIGDDLICLEFPKQNLEERILKGTLDEAVEETVRQALAAKSNRIILAGQSLGGTIALLAGAKLIESGYSSLLYGIVCFSPILSPKSWYSSKNYNFIDDPGQAQLEKTLIRVSRRGRNSQIARRFWDSIQCNPIDNSNEWMIPLIQVKIPILIFLGLHDQQWNDAMVVGIKNSIPTCEVRFESQSRHHFRGLGSTQVVNRVLEWIDEQAAPKAKDKHPAAIVFDWDGVLCSAKSLVNKQKALKKAFFSIAASDERLWNKEIVPECAWANLQHEIALEKLQKHWRVLVLRLGEIAYPSDSVMRARLTIALAARYLYEHRKLLREIHLNKDLDVVPDWGNSLLKELAQHDIKLCISSNSMLDEVNEEAKETGFARYFDRIYGYPVQKINVLKALSRKLACNRRRIFLVDDSRSEVLSAICEGFSSVFLAKDNTSDNLRKMTGLRIIQKDQGILDKYVMKQILLQKDIKTEHLNPKKLARQFLGHQAFVVGRLLNRFGDNPIWRIWHAVNNERVYFLKVLRIIRSEVNQLARILLAMKERGLPVADWLPIKKDYCIELSPRWCAVMETALPGRFIAQEDLTDDQLAEIARTLARLHISIKEISHSFGTLRPHFSTGLDSFNQLVVDFWRLLAYCRYYIKYESDDNPTLTSILRWLDENGLAILLRFNKVNEELKTLVKTKEYQPVLGDFNATNVLFHNNKITGIIDYEDIHNGPRELDVLSFCMFGLSEPHIPNRLNLFVNSYLDENPNSLNLYALSPIARAICHAQLFRQLRRELVAACLSSKIFKSDILDKLNRLNILCLNLDNFNLDRL